MRRETLDMRHKKRVHNLNGQSATKASLLHGQQKDKKPKPIILNHKFKFYNLKYTILIQPCKTLLKP